MRLFQINYISMINSQDTHFVVIDYYKRPGGSAFSLENAIQQFRFTEANWRKFLKDTFFSYRADIARNRCALSHPDEIRFLQQALKMTVDPGLSADGYWGQSTLNSLMEFQRKHGLKPDGILGPNTKAELNRQNEKARIVSLPNHE
ncbi:peptidoglycan-binding domain-containing protein [Kaarinaea lacus]